MRLCQRNQDRSGEANARNNLAGVDLATGRPHAAARHHRRALALYRELGDRRGGQGIATSHKPLSHGHAYQACAYVSRTGIPWSAYFCSPFIPVS